MRAEHPILKDYAGGHRQSVDSHEHAVTTTELERQRTVVSVELNEDETTEDGPSDSLSAKEEEVLMPIEKLEDEDEFYNSFRSIPLACNLVNNATARYPSDFNQELE